MQSMSRATQAYQASSTHRSLRQQEADVFHHAIGALRFARDASPITQVKALADNRRLWTSVINMLQDPANALPVQLRASMVSVGLAVQREMDRDSPDFAFLININESIAAGLAGAA